MKEIKYKGRKKYTPEEAGDKLENIMQLFSTNEECLNYWKYMPRTKSDNLIEAMAGETREEAIKAVEKQQIYLESKMDYMRQFNPDYRIKGSFGAAYHPHDILKVKRETLL